MIASKEQNVKAVQAEYLPTLYVSGGWEHAENQYMVHQDNWSAIAGVNINLSSGGASSSKSGMARAELRSLKLTRDKLLDDIRLEVKSAYLDLQSSALKIEVAKTAVAQAEENLRLQRLRYKEGVGHGNRCARCRDTPDNGGIEFLEVALRNQAGRGNPPQCGRQGPGERVWEIRR